MTKQFGQYRDLSIGIAFGTLLGFLLGWGLLGCSLTGGFLEKDRAISFDISALLGSSPADFEAQLKEMGEISLEYERRREADNAPKGSSAGEPFHRGRCSKGLIALRLARGGPEVKVSFHRTDARAYRIIIDFNKYVSKIDALERLGFDWSELRESPIEAYRYITWTEGRVWLIDRGVKQARVSAFHVPTDGTELCLISLWGPVSSGRRIMPSDPAPNRNTTSVKVQIFGR